MDIDTVREIATAHGATSGQVSSAWLLAKAPDVVPIPGTRRISYLEQNSAAADVSLTDAEIARLDAVPVVGERESALDHNWSNGSTPPHNSF